MKSSNQETKELLAAGTIFSGFAKYPAKLYVKYNKNEKDYTLHEDFSKMEVPVLPLPELR